MSEPTGHCPYLGLKQNRAIRFASPTPEHRCYINGDPIEIPVEQTIYCLSPHHIRCPLYTGSMEPTMDEAIPLVATPPISVPPTGFRTWVDSLSPRDRAIYGLMLLIMAAIISLYLLLAFRALLENQSPSSGNPAVTASAENIGLLATAPISSSPEPSAVPATTATTASDATAVPPTALPTAVPTTPPTERPTMAPIILQPTALVINTPPTTTPSPQAIATTQVVPSKTPAPSATVAAPTASIVPTTSQATEVPLTTISQELVTLYFGDVSGTLFVPVQRYTQVENKQIAAAAIRELLAGSRSGLQRLLLPDAKLLGIRLEGTQAIVNFDQAPTGAGDSRGYYSMVLTLTEFPQIQQVAFQINGQTIAVDGTTSLRRPIVNPLNPEKISASYSTAAFLPLYFLSNDGRHDVRVIRLVSSTKQVAEGTLRALLDGPEAYSYALQQLIPAGTELRGVRLDGDVVVVDFTQPFASATNRDGTLRTIVNSLTTLANVKGVIFLVEGHSLADEWGDGYGGTFYRQLLNQE